ncbi:hypothetical protein L1987_42514 [Smallanthus sonchifolius]|uniref:Uncharacterized protein n=1 Tax=Smallanthus sonchifolius TaxID=185202 RepID=A0ACB9GL14_9ASTR|nr:hypothetical protein L1987_42514 [Smallanthus sonchifolius]
MDGRRKNIAGASSGSNFQMPLHYPRYTKEEYKELPEWMLDRLLAQYGLSASGHRDLESKREFAMGAFLWPPHHSPAQPTSYHDRYRLNGKIVSGYPTVWSFLRKKKV